MYSSKLSYDIYRKNFIANDNEMRKNPFDLSLYSKIFKETTRVLLNSKLTVLLLYYRLILQQQNYHTILNRKFGQNIYVVAFMID